jgi:thioredoxin reductase (NADPH)
MNAMNETIYDVIIVGGGPAGYTAALYCARAALNTLIIEKLAPGGQMATTDRVDNYPGFSDGTDGFTLGMEMQKQAERFGAKSKTAEVQKLDLAAKIKTVTLRSGENLFAKTLILATGAFPRELGLAEESALRGHGVSYCATCDGAFYRKKDVVVVGGGDTAAADALFLSKLCKKVTLVHRRDKLRAAAAYQNPLSQCDNIEFAWDSVVEEILHENKVTGVKIKNVKTGAVSQIACDGLFVAVGNIPNTKMLEGMVELDKSGYIIASEDTQTSVPGVFAAGDVRQKPLRQIVTAAADGAVAAHMVEEYIQSFENE